VFLTETGGDLRKSWRNNPSIKTELRLSDNRSCGNALWVAELGLNTGNLRDRQKQLKKEGFAVHVMRRVP
jgi:hypothetical protein